MWNRTVGSGVRRRVLAHGDPPTKCQECRVPLSVDVHAIEPIRAVPCSFPTFPYTEAIDDWEGSDVCRDHHLQRQDRNERRSIGCRSDCHREREGQRDGKQREEALRLYTVGSSWFSGEDGRKGSLAPGQLADLAVLSADYFSVPDDEIKQLESVLTLVGGKVVYATAEYAKLAPPDLPASPSWSPVAEYGGYARASEPALVGSHSAACTHPEPGRMQGASGGHRKVLGERGLWSLGCDCFAF
jgi:hypothetical protein